MYSHSSQPKMNSFLLTAFFASALAGVVSANCPFAGNVEFLGKMGVVADMIPDCSCNNPALVEKAVGVLFGCPMAPEFAGNFAAAIAALAAAGFPVMTVEQLLTNCDSVAPVLCHIAKVCGVM